MYPDCLVPKDWIDKKVKVTLLDDEGQLPPVKSPYRVVAHTFIVKSNDSNPTMETLDDQLCENCGAHLISER